MASVVRQKVLAGLKLSRHGHRSACHETEIPVVILLRFVLTQGRRETDGVVIGRDGYQPLVESIVLHLLHLLFDQFPHLLQDGQIANVIERPPMKVNHMLMHEHRIQNPYRLSITRSLPRILRRKPGIEIYKPPSAHIAAVLFVVAFFNDNFPMASFVGPNTTQCSLFL